MEEGEVNGQELSIASHSIARISFAKKPHVEQVSAHRVSHSHSIACPRRSLAEKMNYLACFNYRMPSGVLGSTAWHPGLFFL